MLKHKQKQHNLQVSGTLLSLAIPGGNSLLGLQPVVNNLRFRLLFKLHIFEGLLKATTKYPSMLSKYILRRSGFYKHALTGNLVFKAKLLQGQTLVKTKIKSKEKKKYFYDISPPAPPP